MSCPAQWQSGKHFRQSGAVSAQHYIVITATQSLANSSAATSNFFGLPSDNQINAMSLLPASAVVNSGQIVQTGGGIGLQGTPSAFSKLQEGPRSPYQPVTGQLVSPQSSPAPTSLSSTSPLSTDVLKPAFEYTSNSLSELNVRAATIKPTSASESLQTRLDLLNAQFRVLGNHLQESAAKDDPMQLLRLQNDIYQLDEELELVSKVVDQATSGVRSLLQTQL